MATAQTAARLAAKAVTCCSKPALNTLCTRKPDVGFIFREYAGNLRRRHRRRVDYRGLIVADFESWARLLFRNSTSLLPCASLTTTNSASMRLRTACPGRASSAGLGQPCAEDQYAKHPTKVPAPYWIRKGYI